MRRVNFLSVKKCCARISYRRIKWNSFKKVYSHQLAIQHIYHHFPPLNGHGPSFHHVRRQAQKLSRAASPRSPLDRVPFSHFWLLWLWCLSCRFVRVSSLRTRETGLEARPRDVLCSFVKVLVTELATGFFVSWIKIWDLHWHRRNHILSRSIEWQIVNNKQQRIKLHRVSQTMVIQVNINQRWFKQRWILL